MKAHILINSDEPGLVPWGLFHFLLPGIKAGISQISSIDAREIFSEWFYSLYLDEIDASDFNTVLHSINHHVHETDQTGPDRLKSFWNEIWMPIVERDPRYQGTCTPME